MTKTAAMMQVFAALALIHVMAGPLFPARAAEAPPTEGVVRQVLDGDTLRLADGSVVRLAGILVPRAPPAGGTARHWADAATAALAKLVRGRRVELDYGAHPRDRHGRWLAQVVVAGSWVQGRLLEAGLARVQTDAEGRERAVAMLAAEATARRAGRGVWRDPRYRPISPDEASRRVGSFQLVEGTPRALAEIKGRTYVNYGSDWRSDFTLVIAAPARRLLAEAGLDPAGLVGGRLRVRGWLEWANGPMITVTHPEQIEPLP